MPGDFTFTAELWEWDAREGAWTFVTLPHSISDQIDDLVAEPAGFGSVKVNVQIGATAWSTSLFPDKGSGSFVLPIKKAVRTAESLDTGDDAEVTVRVVTS